MLCLAGLTSRIGGAVGEHEALDALLEERLRRFRRIRRPRPRRCRARLGQLHLLDLWLPAAVARNRGNGERGNDVLIIGHEEAPSVQGRGRRSASPKIESVAQLSALRTPPPRRSRLKHTLISR